MGEGLGSGEDGEEGAASWTWRGNGVQDDKEGELEAGEEEAREHGVLTTNPALWPLL